MFPLLKTFLAPFSLSFLGREISKLYNHISCVGVYVSIYSISIITCFQMPFGCFKTEIYLWRKKICQYWEYSKYELNGAHRTGWKIKSEGGSGIWQGAWQWRTQWRSHHKEMWLRMSPPAWPPSDIYIHWYQLAMKVCLTSFRCSNPAVGQDPWTQPRRGSLTLMEKEFTSRWKKCKQEGNSLEQ